MSEFNYQPAFGARLTRRPRAVTASFGDGYSQRTLDGINTSPQSWALTFKRIASEIAAIETFLEGKKGVTAFTWTPPGKSEIKVICPEWQRGLDEPGVGVITATFEQVFE